MGRTRPKPLNTPENFWAGVMKGDDCWLWLRGKNRDGYGLLCYQRRKTSAHRIAWELTYGPIPTGKLVLHHCDNPPCCRPDHLFVGTPLDNRRDCIAKKRDSRGIIHPRARLVDYDGESMTLSQFAEAVGHSLGGITKYLNMGRTPEEIVLILGQAKKELVQIEGDKKTMKEWDRILTDRAGLKRGSFKSNVYRHGLAKALEMLNDRIAGSKRICIGCGVAFSQIAARQPMLYHSIECQKAAARKLRMSKSKKRVRLADGTFRWTE